MLLLIAAVVASFAGLIELSLELIEPKLPEYAEQAQALAQSGQAWLRDHGLPTGQDSQNSAFSQLFQQAFEVDTRRPLYAKSFGNIPFGCAGWVFRDPI